MLGLALSLLSDASSLIDDALTTHIYEDEDDIPEDCGYKGCVEEIEALTPRITAYLASAKAASTITATTTVAA